MAVNKFSQAEIDLRAVTLAHKLGISIEQFNAMPDDKVFSMMEKKGLVLAGIWPGFYLDLARGRVSKNYTLILDDDIEALV